jgi:hypothetical protein
LSFSKAAPAVRVAVRATRVARARNVVPPVARFPPARLAVDRLAVDFLVAARFFVAARFALDRFTARLVPARLAAAFFAEARLVDARLAVAREVARFAPDRFPPFACFADLLFWAMVASGLREVRTAPSSSWFPGRAQYGFVTKRR